LALLVLLAACGDLPHPFKDMPGANALRLAQPPPSRLAIPMPTDALLDDQSARVWSGALADGLQAQELPASANEPGPGDWRIVLSAHMDPGGSVVPTYTVVDPRGTAQGSVDGPAVAARAWAAGDAGTLKAAATAEVPKLLSLLTSVEAHRQQSDPNSLLNRPPRVFFAGVTGAPGDGNTALTRLMVARLPTLGDVLVDSARAADFTVRGEIKTAPGAGKSVRVEIQWIIVDAQARESGRVVQINEVPPGTLDHYWGEVAEVVATEAAGGVHEVVQQASGRGDPQRDPPRTGAAKAGTAAPAKPPAPPLGTAAGPKA
jgi:hypothetical protein